MSFATFVDSVLYGFFDIFLDNFSAATCCPAHAMRCALRRAHAYRMRIDVPDSHVCSAEDHDGDCLNIRREFHRFGNLDMRRGGACNPLASGTETLRLRS